jgi:hypothetical protein
MSARYPQFPATAASVTDVIGFYFPPNKYYTTAGRDEGTALHVGCHYLSEGDLDWSSVPQAILPRLRQYERFLKDTGFKPVWKEKALYDKDLGIVGTLDAGGELDGRMAVVDYKRGPFLKPVRLQTAGYKGLALASGLYVEDRYSLHLGLDKYDLIKHDDDEDEEVFKALVAAYYGKEQYL